MFAFLFFLIMSSTAFADDCRLLFDARGSSASAPEAAMACYQKSLSSAQSNTERAFNLNRLSYLKFFMAEYFLDRKLQTLEESFSIAEQSVLLFGEKYDLTAYRGLSDAEKTELAWGLYQYGLSLSRYVDLRGVSEALRRMNDIKRSMATILRIQAESVAFHGAHRVLGIFHMKVPAIAGGDIRIAKDYLPLAVMETRHSGGLSVYPLNNVVYADLLYKTGDKTGACEQLKMVASLSEADVTALANGFTFETLGHVRDARAKMNAWQCR